MSALPNNWKLMLLKDEVVSVKGKKPKILKEEAVEGFVPYVDIKAFEKGILTKYADPNDGVFTEKEDTLMVWDGARSGLVGNGIQGVIGSTLVKIRPKFSHYRYLHYFLKSQFDFINTNTKGTGIPHVDPVKLWGISYPLAPLNEQIRIADKLDSILAKVDQSQARLDKIPTILKRFRQSVLAAATSGELTKEWREKNGLSLSSWENTIFSELSREITVGFVGKMSDKYEESGIKFLRSQNVRAFKFDSKNLLYISPEFHKEIYKSRLEAGDLAVVRSGAPGTTCVIPENLGEANCSDLVIVRPNDKLIPEFGCIFMNSTIAQANVKDNQVGVAQQHFNVGSMKIMPINLPPLAEQIEIVRRVESLFSLADATEKNFIAIQIRVKKLTQSILKKAFRGKLVEQDSNDEPASKLLERIKTDQIEVKISKKAEPKPKRPMTTEAKVVQQTITDSLRKFEKKSSVHLDEKLGEKKDHLRTQYQAEINRAQNALKEAKFTVEQFRSVIEFKGDYDSLKMLIMNLVKGIPGLSEPLLEIDSWDEKSGDYLLRLMVAK